MFFVKFLILFVLIPTVMIVLSSAVGPISRIGITYLLFPAVLLAIVLVRFAKENRQR